MVTANLVHAERDRLVLAGVLALDHQHRNAVDEKDQVLARPVMAVVKIKLFGYLVDIAVLFRPSCSISVIDQDQIQLPIFFSAEEFSLVAQVGQKLTVTGNVGIQPPQLPDQRAFCLFVLWIESEDLSVKQVVEV